MYEEIFAGINVNVEDQIQVTFNEDYHIIIHNMIDDRLRGYKFYKKDAYKFYNTLDCNSSRFCFQKSLESLMDAYMFSKNRLIVKEKWRIKWLQQNSSQLCDELISLYSTITKAASINHSTLTQLFKEKLDMTPIEYLWHYRIIVAKKHLEFTSLQIKEISKRCGFKTIQHFSRKFEAFTNYTPTAFRDMAVAERKAALQK